MKNERKNEIERMTKVSGGCNQTKSVKTLWCYQNGYCTGSVDWFRDEKKIFTNQSSIEVKSEDEGNFTCRIENFSYQPFCTELVLESPNYTLLIMIIPIGIILASVGNIYCWCRGMFCFKKQTKKQTDKQTDDVLKNQTCLKESAEFIPKSAQDQNP